MQTEQTFTVEQNFNQQNDRVYPHSSNEAVEKNWESRKRSLFCYGHGATTRAANHQTDILEKVVKPLNDSESTESSSKFPPPYKAQSMQSWLAANLPEFITAAEWSSGSLDSKRL
ncbi:hypothetical protein Trydic_g3489 [Trypoxylus dichotomus]